MGLIQIGKPRKITPEAKQEAVVLLSKIKGTEVKKEKKPIYLDVEKDADLIHEWINTLIGRKMDDRKDSQ